MSNSTRVRKRLESSSPCSSFERMLPLCRQMKSAMAATIPLRSGQETRRMAKLGIVYGARNFAYSSFVLQRLYDLTRGVGSRASRQTSAGMGAIAAKEEAIDGRLVAGPVE